jgi:hypothetical protein
MSTTIPDSLQTLFDAGFTAETAAEAIAHLDALEQRARELAITSAEEFAAAYALKRFVSALACYTFNHQLDSNDRVWALEGRLGRTMSRWARAFSRGRVSPEGRTLVRYLLWNKRYTNEDFPKIVGRLVDEQAIFRASNKVYVRGCHLAVGDNVFSSRQDGRSFRRYQKVAVPEVFRVSRSLPPELLALIPEEAIPAFVHVVPICDDGKEAARITLSGPDRTRLVTAYCRHR